MKRLAIILATALAIFCAASPASAESSRKMPSAYNVSTFGGPARDYTTLSAWESATDNDLVSAAKGEVLYCYPDSASFDQYVTVSGATANSSYFRVIRAAPGYERQVVFDYTGALGVYGGVVNVASEKFVGIYDLVIRHHGNEANITKDLFFNANTEPARVAGCVVGPSVNVNAAGVAGAQTYNGGKALFINSAFRGDTATTSIYGIVAGTAGGTVAYNCVIHRYSVNWYGAAGGIAKNSIFATGFTNFYGTAPTQTACIAGNASVVAFSSPDTGNFQLLSTATNAIDAGTDLSADGTFAFSDDIDGETRPYGSAWDIGIDEWGTPASEPSALVSVPVF